MSVSGIANATAGSLAADGLKALLTSQDNKPATKGDIKAVLNRLERYHLINNFSSDQNGALPYFDLETKNIVYLKTNALRPRWTKPNN